MGEGALILHTGGDKDKKENCRFKKDTNFFFTKGSSSKSTSKALSGICSITTITDAVVVIPSNSQKKV